MLCRIAKRLRFPRRTAVPVRTAARPPAVYPPDVGTGYCADAPRRSAYTAQARCLCAIFAQTDRHHSGKTAVTARKSDRRPDAPPSRPAPHSRCPPQCTVPFPSAPGCGGRQSPAGAVPVRGAAGIPAAWRKSAPPRRAAVPRLLR